MATNGRAIIMINHITAEIKLIDLINIRAEMEELQDESSFLAVDTVETLNGIIYRLNNGLVEVSALINELDEIKTNNELFYTQLSRGKNND